MAKTIWHLRDDWPFQPPMFWLAGFSTHTPFTDKLWRTWMASQSSTEYWKGHCDLAYNHRIENAWQVIIRLNSHNKGCGKDGIWLQLNSLVSYSDALLTPFVWWLNKLVWNCNWIKQDQREVTSPFDSRVHHGGANVMTFPKLWLYTGKTIQNQFRSHPMISSFVYSIAVNQMETPFISMEMKAASSILPPPGM